MIVVVACTSTSTVTDVLDSWNGNQDSSSSRMKHWARILSKPKYPGHLIRTFTHVVDECNGAPTTGKPHTMMEIFAESLLWIREPNGLESSICGHLGWAALCSDCGA